MVCRPARLAWCSASLKTSLVVGDTRSRGRSQTAESRRRCASIAWRIACGFSVEVVHHLGEHVPLHLREREKQVLVRQQRVLAAARFLDRAVDDALGAIANLAR